ncbi:MAG: hypothetical protein WA738_17020 [Candidatus Angelobacter sp.]
MQITISSRPPGQAPIISPRLSFWQRFKLLITGIGVAVVALAVLVAALVLGSILAVVIGIAILAVLVTVLIKLTLKRARS